MDIVTLALAKKFTEDTVKGMGAIKGDKGEPGTDGKNGIDGVSPAVAVNSSTDSEYTLKITDSTQTIITPNLKGSKGDTGAQGIKGEKGEQGVQGVQGETGAKGDKGDKGDDGYPFLIYKQYDSIDDFNADDFPEVGLMFMINEFETDNGYPIYRYTGDGNYSLITYMNTEGIKGEKGDKGDKGDTGDKGSDGLNGIDGTTYTPVVKSVSTLDSDASAIVSVELNDENKTAGFSFGIPKGKDGKDGENGQDGKDADMSRVEALESAVETNTTDISTLKSNGTRTQTACISVEIKNTAVYARKKNGVVTVNGATQIASNLTRNKWVTILTIPIGYRPPNYEYGTAVIDSGEGSVVCPVDIDTNGNMRIFTYGKSIPEEIDTTNKYVFISATYISA